MNSDEFTNIKYLNEDELPENIPDAVYSAMFKCSAVDFVRLFPYIEHDGKKCFLVCIDD